MKSGAENKSEMTMDKLELFEDFLNAHEKEIYCYIFRYTRSQEDAEELTQETFLKFYKNMEKLDLQKSPRALLYSIAHSKTFDWFRKMKNGALTFSQIEAGSTHDGLDEAIQVIDMRSSVVLQNLRLDIEKGFLKIRPIYASVLKMFYLDGYSYQEIARELYLPLNTVKTYLLRGKNAMREQLL